MTDILYLYDERAAPPKVEIARVQIEAAIKALIRGDHAIVVHTLATPALQILRDLNKDNRSSLAQTLHDICEEEGLCTKELWREFNANSANWLKHATRKDVVPSFEKMRDSRIGLLAFCIWEYCAYCGGVSSVMAAFAKSYFGKSDWPQFFQKSKCRIQIAVGDFGFFCQFDVDQIFDAFARLDPCATGCQREVVSLVPELHMQLWLRPSPPEGDQSTGTIAYRFKPLSDGVYV